MLGANHRPEDQAAMTRRLAIIGMTLTLLAAPASTAADRSTIEQRVDDAVAYYHAHGVGALCKAVTDPDGPFMVDEAYVFFFLRQGPLICHPRPDLNAMRRDRSFVPEILANAEARPDGAWTRYPWPHPETFEVLIKSTYCRIADRLVICAGAYFDVGMV